MESRHFSIDQKVLSKDHKQPGIVVGTGHTHNPWRYWFDVEWIRHPGKTRRYYAGINREFDVEDWVDFDYESWPTPVDEFDWEGDDLDKLSAEVDQDQIASKAFQNAEARQLVAFVDNLERAREAAKDAVLKAVVTSDDSPVGIDINTFVLALFNNGWTFTADGC